MRVAVFGLGYIGLICGACLADSGHLVTGYDVQAAKVGLINKAQAPVFEPGLQQLIDRVVPSGNFKATDNAAVAVSGAEVILVCVGTPASTYDSVDTSQLIAAIEEIALHLKSSSDYPVIAIRSTVPPGSLRSCIELVEKTTQLSAGSDFGMILNPEFLREGTALSDFKNPSCIVVNGEDPRAVARMENLYADLPIPVSKASCGAVEMIKYASNAFHALKVAFANEMGVICKAHRVDGQELMKLFCEDTKLNISDAYLKPGSAYGGSCLPKDVAALNQLARQHDLDTPILSQIAISNAAHVEHSIRLVESTGHKRLGFLGLTFKAGTDDLRKSPAIQVVETLLKRGCDIRVYDPNVLPPISDDRVAHLSSLLLDTAEELLDFSDAIVLTYNDVAFAKVLDKIGENHTLVDMTGMAGRSISGGQYHGVCW